MNVREFDYQTSSIWDGVWRVFKFCCVGVLSTGISFGAYLVLSNIMNLCLAYALSWIVACVCSYVMNKLWTFRATDTGLTPFIKFVTVNLCSLGLGLLAMYVLTSLGGGRIWSYIFSLPITMTASYLGYRYWSFKNIDGRL